MFVILLLLLLVVLIIYAIVKGRGDTKNKNNDKDNDIITVKPDNNSYVNTNFRPSHEFIIDHIQSFKMVDTRSGDIIFSSDIMKNEDKDKEDNE